MYSWTLLCNHSFWQVKVHLRWEKGDLSLGCYLVSQNHLTKPAECVCMCVMGRCNGVSLKYMKKYLFKFKMSSIATKFTQMKTPQNLILSQRFHVDPIPLETNKMACLQICTFILCTSASKCVLLYCLQTYRGLWLIYRSKISTWHSKICQWLIITYIRY